jgi:transcriptional/translational regulatory protein YebC/TACO1
MFRSIILQTQASTILGKKAANDLARANKLSKLSKQITAAVRAGNYETDPKHNLYLSSAINVAKTLQVPKNVIHDAIQRAVSKNQGFQLNTYQGIQGNIAFMVEASTGNLKKTSSELKFIFKDSGGAMSSVDYLFEHLCFITIEKNNLPEELELLAIELNALDVQVNGESYLIKCHVKDMHVIKTALEKCYKLLEIKIAYDSPEKLIPENVTNFKMLLNRLQNQEEVANVFHNAILPVDLDSQ